VFYFKHEREHIVKAGRSLKKRVFLACSLMGLLNSLSSALGMTTPHKRYYYPDGNVVYQVSAPSLPFLSGSHAFIGGKYLVQDTSVPYIAEHVGSRSYQDNYEIEGPFQGTLHIPRYDDSDCLTRRPCKSI
jgi:hypothetical protein